MPKSSVPAAVVIALLCGALLSCSVMSGRRENTSGPAPVPTLDVEYRIKLEGSGAVNQGDCLPLDIRSEERRRTPDEGPLIYPVSLALSEDRALFISDNNAQKIYYRSPSSPKISTFAPRGDEVELEWPNSIRFHDQEVFVSDNQGIKVFNNIGSFERLIRVYYQVADFAVGQGGIIYANPFFATQASSKPLIVKLSQEGTLIKGFGQRVAPPDHYGLEDKAFLCLSGNYIFAAFLHRPLVQVYTQSGTLVKEFPVDGPSFDKLATLARDERFTSPRAGAARLPSYIAGASVVGDRLMILLDLPKTEIVEFDFDGNERGRHCSREEPVREAQYRGFEGRLADGRYTFWVIVGNSNDDLDLVEYSFLPQH